ncbi:Sel1 repeat protein [compost metagenome]
MYGNGNGVNIDYAKALYWLRKSARQGHSHGFYGMGWIYENGFSVQQNAVKALAYYQLAERTQEPSLPPPRSPILTKRLSADQLQQANSMVVVWKVGELLPGDD